MCFSSLTIRKTFLCHCFKLYWLLTFICFVCISVLTVLKLLNVSLRVICKAFVEFLEAYFYRITTKNIVNKMATLAAVA